jgi:hypothetical protein
VSGRVERIVVVLDAVSENRAALAAAARLAARWRARLHGIFVEHDELISLARLPFARQVTLGIGVEALTPQHAARQTRAFAERARRDLVAVAGRHGVESSFEIVHDAPVHELTVVLASDLFVASIASRPIGGHFRVECRWWSARPAAASFLLAHHDGPEQGAIAAVLQNREPAAERLLDIAAQLAEADGGILAVICSPELAKTPGFKAWLDKSLVRHAVKAELDLTPSDPEALLRRIIELECRLVALEEGAALAQPEKLRELVAKLACDVLVVR